MSTFSSLRVLLPTALPVAAEKRAASEDRAVSDVVVELLGSCLRQHRALHERLIPAYDVFLEEQQRQEFGRRARGIGLFAARLTIIQYRLMLEFSLMGRPMVAQMIAVGEETGNLDAMLSKVADFYEAEVAAAVKALTSILEPVMIILVGGIVGFIVIAMYMPMFKVYDAIK